VNVKVENSNYPVVTGVLSIVSGVFGAFTGVGMIIVSAVFWGAIGLSVSAPDEFPFFVFQTVYLVIGIIFLSLSILAIVGGIFALQKRYWGLTLAGAIASIFTFFPTGIAAIIFAGLSRQDFKQ
jgi:hypothetical protein